MQAAGVQRSSTFLISYRYQHDRQGVLTCAVVAWLSHVRATAFQLDLKSAPHKELHIWY